MADAKPKTVTPLYCSFCGKSQHEARDLIAGPTVFICDECVELCMVIITEERAGDRLRKAMRDRGEIIVSKADAALIAWMKTGETTASAPAEPCRP